MLFLVLAVELECAKAESLRRSSSASSDLLLLLLLLLLPNAGALGPGEVLGRRTLLSHPREAGALIDDDALGSEEGWCAATGPPLLGVAAVAAAASVVVAVAAASAASTAALMAAFKVEEGGTPSCH